MWKVYRRQTTDDGRQVMAIVHLDLWSRWTKKLFLMVLDEWPSIQYFYKLFIQVACCFWKICPPIFHRKPIIMTSYGSYRYTRCDIVEIYNVINFIEDISPVNLTKRTMWVIAVTLHCLFFLFYEFFSQKPKHLNIKSGNVFFFKYYTIEQKHIHCTHNI
jgi:hypothetical protein